MSDLPNNIGLTVASASKNLHLYSEKQEGRTLENFNKFEQNYLNKILCFIIWLLNTIILVIIIIHFRPIPQSQTHTHWQRSAIISIFRPDLISCWQNVQCKSFFSSGEILNLARSKFYTWRHRWHSAVDRWAGVLGLNVSVARVENWYWYSLSNLEGPPPPLLKTCLDKGHNNKYLTVTNHGTIGLAKKWSSEQTKLSCKLVLTSYCHYDNF